TCEPTFTSATGLMVPVAVTVWLMAPMSTAVVRYFDGGTVGSPFGINHAAAAPPTTITPAAIATRFFVENVIVLFFNSRKDLVCCTDISLAMHRASTCAGMRRSVDFGD